MKNICILTVKNLFTIPSLQRYVDLFGKNNFDIVYWDRCRVDEDCGARKHFVMKYELNDYDSYWKKFVGYSRFMLFGSRILKKYRYDIIIVIPTQTGVIFNRLLRNHFSGKYIFDIQDYTKEYSKAFFYLMERLIKNSAITTITSPAFNDFLPKHDYLIAHNIVKISQQAIFQYRKRIRKTEGRIVISCIGGIRFYEQFIKIIKFFANDDRYMLRFIGIGSEQLSKYCEKNKITNVELIGRFSPEKTLDFYMGTDVIMNVYGNNSPLLDYLLSNKLYYAATLGIPILVSPNTFMEEVTIKAGFGIICDLDNESTKIMLYKYYYSINWSVFYKKCDDFMKLVYEDDSL